LAFFTSFRGFFDVAMGELISEISSWAKALLSGQLPSVLFGWILGITGTLGVERYNEWKRRRRFVAGVRIELARLQAGMAVIFWNLSDREGAIGREEIKWVTSRTERAVDDEAVASFRANFSKASDFSDDYIAALKAAGRKRKQQAVSLRTYTLPFLEANLSELASIADPPTVSSLLNVRTQLNIYNEVVEETRGFHRMTFDSSLTPENHQKVLTLVEGGYGALLKRAKWIADHLESALSSKPLMNRTPSA
jgi:hypothetical protein